MRSVASAPHWLVKRRSPGLYGVLTLLGGCAGAAGDGAPKPLVFVRPSDPLQLLVQRLFSERCHMAPVIDGDPLGEGLLINSKGMSVCCATSAASRLPLYLRSSMSTASIAL